MKLTKKIVIFILLICVFFSILFSLLFRWVITEPVDEQKRMRAQQIVAGAVTALENEKLRLRTVNEDWAVWDTMYNYVSNPTEAVYKDLSPRALLKGSDISLILIVNKEKQTIVLEGYDELKEMPLSFNQVKQKQGPVWNYLVQTFAEFETHGGLIPTEHGPMLLISTPVLHGNDTGPINGRVMMGRIVHRHFGKMIHDSIREETRLLVPHRAGQTKEPRTNAGDDGNGFIMKEETDHLRIDYPVKDVWGGYLFTIRVEAGKRMFEILEEANRLFFLLLMAGFLLLGAVFYFIVHRLVVRRVTGISSQTDQIVTFDHLDRRIETQYRDEITQLGRNVNKMLQRLQTEHTRREEIEQTLMLNDKLIFLGKVTAKIAHEVNNPLFAIDNSFGYLKKHLPPGDEQLAKVMGMMEKEIQRVRNITRDMHQYSVGQPETFTMSNLSTIIDAAINVITWSRQVRDTQINFRKRDRSFSLHCNPDTLQQVFMNIIINAVEAMKGGGKLEIDISGEGADYRVDFTDNGPGFDKTIKALLFIPFQTTKSGEGMGLGLYISNNIISNHGGTIQVDYDYKDGALLVVRIPKERDPAAPVTPTAEPNEN
ncbi:MAG: HAMP domain-containing protein [bacterium]|nr:HAMP domain-containing protein [bacterium]